MTNTQTAVQAQKVEVRSSVNDKVVITFEHKTDNSVNLVTAGYNRVCAAFGIDRMNAENRYYVAKA